MAAGRVYDYARERVARLGCPGGVGVVDVRPFADVDDLSLDRLVAGYERDRALFGSVLGEW